MMHGTMSLKLINILSMEVTPEPSILYLNNRGHNKNTEMLCFLEVGKKIQDFHSNFIQNLKYLFWGIIS